MAKFNVKFDEALCKACCLCMTACPKDLIVLNTEITNDSGYTPAMMSDMESCIGCCSCARMCPDCVITIEKND
ncbi:4Fe-4S binding protein [Lachnospiraceae bacterium NSJ-143]|nr:4Fe-4S binding protein [Lachnospiraceae bacterium NSJ-143]